MNSSQNLRFLNSALEQLKGYLLSDDIFWNLSLPTNYPQFTLGNLLLAETELNASKLPASEQEQRKELLADLAAQKKEWRTNWERKAQKEFGARLRQWVVYLEELNETRNRTLTAYKADVRVRVLIELLGDEVPSLRDQLAGLDPRLKRLVDDGDFIWDEDMKGAFPKSKYWFLWAKPSG